MKTEQTQGKREKGEGRDLRDVWNAEVLLHDERHCAAKTRLRFVIGRDNAGLRRRWRWRAKSFPSGRSDTLRRPGDCTSAGEARGRGAGDDGGKACAEKATHPSDSRDRQMLAAFPKAQHTIDPERSRRCTAI